MMGIALLSFSWRVLSRNGFYFSAPSDHLSNLMGFVPNPTSDLTSPSHVQTFELNTNSPELRLLRGVKVLRYM